AHFAGRCDGARYQQFRPTLEELLELSRRFPPPRNPNHDHHIQRDRPHPLPECRLNEFACLIHKAIVDPWVMPNDGIPPFGAYNYGLDMGSAWFRYLNWVGLRLRNIHMARLFDHAC